MILHITNDYSGSKVYKNLIRELDNLEISQIVYNPIKEKNRINKNSIGLKSAESKIIYSLILNKFSDRLLYQRKIEKIVKDIENQIDLSKISLIHAHTWYSDGGVAYLLSKKYSIPYIVTIRNSDVNVFQKYFIHERKFGREILEMAKSVILIAASYKERVLSESSLRKIKAIINNKLLIIPNGVDDFWIKSREIKERGEKKSLKFLYIGKFNPSKNVVNLVKAIKILNKNKVCCTLDLVGGGGKDESKILKLIDEYPNIFKYHDRVYNKEKLKEIYLSCDVFTMPSSKETFGLVYIEAMLQGLPVLYTAKEGIDGFYEEKIGENVNKSASALEIQQALLKIIDNYNTYEIPTEKLIAKHNWNNIALIYKNLYNQ